MPVVRVEKHINRGINMMRGAETGHGILELDVNRRSDAPRSRVIHTISGGVL
jgi:hypothetical protein